MESQKFGRVGLCPMDAASRPRRTGDPTASREQHSTDHVGLISRPSPRPSDRVPRRRPTDAVRRRVRWTLSNPASDAVQAMSHPLDAASSLALACSIADPSDDQRRAIEGRSDAGSDAVHRNEGPRAHRTAPMTSDGGGEIARYGPRPQWHVECHVGWGSADSGYPTRT